jgi:hypothetical protein
VFLHPGPPYSRTNSLVIGMQNGPTSASKTDPPGFMGTLGQSQMSLAGVLLALVGQGRFRVRFPRRVKRRQALRGRNLPRDSSADGVPMALVSPQRLCPSGGSFLLMAHQSSCLGKSRGSGGRAPRTLTLPGASACFSRSPFSSCFSSTHGSESFHHSSRKCCSGVSTDPVMLPSSAPPGTPGPTR